MDMTRAKEILQNWTTLTKTLGSLEEDELWLLLSVEMKIGKRRSFLERIHSAYCHRRDAREREQILEGAA